MRLFLDVTRIATRVLYPTPTGIDRVEFAYATEILRKRLDLSPVATITTPYFSGAVRNENVLDLLARIERNWAGPASAAADPVYERLAAELAAPVDTTRPNMRRIAGARSEHVWRNMFFPLRSLVRARVRLDRQLGRAGPNAVYLNTSHTMLDRPRRFDWLARRNLPAALFLHDAIPLDFPEFVSPAGYGRHRARLEVAARLAHVLVVNSGESRDRLSAHLSAMRLPIPEIAVVPLAVTDTFLRPPLAAPSAQGRGAVPYFVVVGTIEPRKNLLFILEVWRRLVARLGTRTPRLVIAGRRGWENENILDVLERSRALAPFVCEVSDLGDEGLAALLGRASGLLAPSSVEGYGLPIAEALSLGVPVLASDIPTHREIFAPYACLLDPIDGPAWVSAIDALAEPDGPFRQGLKSRAARFRARSWGQHVAAAVAEIRRVVTVRADRT